MFDRPLSVTEIVNRQFYGQDRKASRNRIGRQNHIAKREAHARTQVCFLTVAERDDLAARLQAIVSAPRGALEINAHRALRLISGAEPSYRRRGCVAVMVAHQDAVLLGNVLRRFDEPVPGLARLDAIAGRSDRRAS